MAKVTRDDYALISDFRAIAIAKEIILNLTSGDIAADKRAALKHLSAMHDTLDQRLERLKS